MGSRATRFQIESQSAVLSFPRKRESIVRSMSCWMPACAGMTPGRRGLIANCSSSTPWGWRTSRLQGAIEGPEPEMRAAPPRKVRAKQLTARRRLNTGCASRRHWIKSRARRTATRSQGLGRRLRFGRSSMRAGIFPVTPSGAPSSRRLEIRSRPLRRDARRSGRYAIRPPPQTTRATQSAIARLAVKPGDSMPNRLINPASP